MVIVMHGTKRNADTYRDQWHDVGDERGRLGGLRFWTRAAAGTIRMVFGQWWLEIRDSMGGSMMGGNAGFDGWSREVRQAMRRVARLMKIAEAIAEVAEVRLEYNAAGGDF